MKNKIRVISLAKKHNELFIEGQKEPILLKERHLKCSVFADGVIKPLVFFNRPELFKKLMQQGDKPFHAAAQISENHWRGRVSIELIGVDVAFF